MSGEPTVAATSEDSADRFADASETLEEIPSTFFSCWLVVDTVAVTSSISGVAPSLRDRMEVRTSSRTLPSFRMGTASSSTRSANTPAAIRPAISPPDIDVHLLEILWFVPPAGCVVKRIAADVPQVPYIQRSPRRLPRASLDTL